MMRITQRLPNQPVQFTRDVTIVRGVTTVTPSTGEIRLVGLGQILLVSARFVLTPPGTGAWAITVPSLAGYADQIFGQIAAIGTGTGAVPAKLSAGVITPVGTLPEPGTNGIVTISGMVF